MISSSLASAALLRTPAIAVCLGAFWLAGLSSRADTATRFVERLRQEGHADLVLDYLDRAKDNPLVSDEFKKRLPLERLATLLAQIEANERTPQGRIEALRAILPELRESTSSSPAAGRLLTEAVDRLGSAMADQGRREALAAKRAADGQSKKQSLESARTLLQGARERLGEAEERIVAERETLKGVNPDSPKGERRQTLGVRLGFVRLLRARLLHELAETHPAESDNRKKLNTDAAKQLGELYEKYSKWGVGLYAHLYEGRCYRLLGNKQLAFAALEDLTAQPAPDPDLRRIVTLAHAERAALLRDTGKLDEALDKPVAWLENLSGREDDGPEAATLQYHVALASLMRAEDANGADKRRLLKQARDWLGDSSKIPSEVQAEARQQWAEVTASMGIESKPPKDFDEAFQAGGEAIEAMLAVDVALKGATGEEAKRLQGQRATNRDAAYEALTAATRLADKRTDPDEAARARYQLAWLDWDRGDTAKAAKRSAVVARAAADTPSGEEAARLALAALERQQREGGQAELGEFAAYVIQQWPGSEVAQAASAVMVGEALRTGDFAAAEQVLESVPDAQRPALALRLSVARWERGKSDAAQRNELLKRLDRAYKSASQAGDDSPLAVTATLYLAEARLEEGDAPGALKLLNNPDRGPAPRVREGEAPANNPVFALAALKTQARAQALAGKDFGGTLDRLAKVIADAPSETTGGDRAWLGLAVALQADLDRASASAAESIAPALADVLDRLAPVEESGDWNTRLWIAQTRLLVGEKLGDEQAASDSVSAGREALIGLIGQAESQPGFAPSKTSLLAARLRLAQCQRELGEYAEAVDTLVEMLDGGPVLLDVQRTAAETLQQWGQESKDASRLEEAIAGTRPGADGKNLIWGWSKLAAVSGRFAAGNPKQREAYFRAWRGVAESRYQSALLAGGAQKAEQLKKATATIRAMQRQDPALGGADSKRAYDQLLKKINSAAGR
ncbi:hypothetical protein MalM25_27160 [Planctomycetes bacterium MalM25]|nr:hypothetical protein MalM25_27160 [Planctomycetes bacterium MalM25]